MWSVISIITPHVKSGRMKGLAIAARERAPGLPDVPTTAEAGMPDFAVSGWYGLVGPAKLPRDVVDKVNAAALKALQDPKVIERLATVGSQPIGAGPAEFDAHIKREIGRWNKVLKTAGIKLN
jgi:tripartite-type tricarboxylate transporter receptor subunit TctC